MFVLLSGLMCYDSVSYVHVTVRHVFNLTKSSVPIGSLFCVSLHMKTGMFPTVSFWALQDDPALIASILASNAQVRSQTSLCDEVSAEAAVHCCIL